VRKYCDIDGFYNNTRNSIEEFGSPDKGGNFWICKVFHNWKFIRRKEEEEEAAHPGVYEPPIRNSGLLSGMENVLSVMQSILLE
jgi:hypothetical protein